MFSFSLEGLTGGTGVGNKPSSSLEITSANTKELRHPFSGEERGDSLVSLSEEDLESGQRDHRMFDQQVRLKWMYIASMEKNNFYFPKYVLVFETKKARVMLILRPVPLITYH